MLRGLCLPNIDTPVAHIVIPINSKKYPSVYNCLCHQTVRFIVHDKKAFVTTTTILIRFVNPVSSIRIQNLYNL